MIRSVDFPVDPRVIRNPTNSPLATKGARLAAAARTRLCIETIGLILSEHFTKPGRYVIYDGITIDNRWTVRLTRISMGTVDPITGGATMKAVQDAVARWCDVPNERDPIWSWVEPIGQEKRGFVKGADGKKRAWTGVRIEIEDLAPGEPRRVVLATIAGFEVRAKAAIKERAKAAKMRGRTQVYHAAEGQKAASSAARGRAEEAFAKVTGKRVERSINIVHMKHTATPEPMAHRDPVPKAATPEQRARVFAELRAAGSEDASPRMLVACRVHDADPGEWCDAERKTICATRKRLAGLAVAGARVLGPKPATGPKKKARAAVILAGVPLSAHDPACCAHAQAAKGEPVTCCNCPAGCPEQAAMRAQARSVACAVCGAGYVDGPPCVNVPEAVRCPTCGTNWGAFAEGRCMVCLDCPGNVRLERYAPPFEYGVHASRARAAGLPAYPCAADLDAGALPVRVEARCGRCDGGGVVCGLGQHVPGWCNEEDCDHEETCQRSENGCGGSGAIERWTWLPGRGAEVWLVLPWNARECDAGCEDGVLEVYDPVTEIGPRPERCRRCDGTGKRPLFTRAKDLHDPPPDRLTFAVPVSQQMAHGRTVTLHRTTITTRAGRLAWLFTAEERTRS